MTMHFSIEQQRGAALVVGMVLLLVLTLLAVAGMNTASLEFMMAGNQQYRSRAFEASEAGIQVAFAQGNLNPANPQVFTNTMGTGNESYRAVVSAVTDGFGNPVTSFLAQSGYDVSSFGTYQFVIQSTGTSSRNSTAVHTQELYTLANSPSGSPPVIQPGGGPPGNAPPALQ